MTLRFFKNSLLLILLMAAPAALAAGLREAEAHVAEERYAEALKLVDALQRREGASPRLESLRALSLNGLGRSREAYLSLLAYFAMTAKLPLDKEPGHIALVDLRDRLKRELAQEQARRKEQAHKEREAAAKALIEEQAREQARLVEAREQAFQKKVLKRVQVAGQNLTEAELKEIKRAYPTALSKLDPRVLRLDNLDTGKMRLGMNKSDFEVLMLERLEGHQPQSRFGRQLLADLRAVIAAGVPKNTFEWTLKFASGAYGSTNFSWIGTEATERYGWKTREKHDGDVLAINHLISPLNPSPELRALAPHALMHKVTFTQFNPQGRLAELHVSYVFPWDFRDLNAVAKAFQEQLGAPAQLKIERDIFHHSSNALKFEYRGIGGTWASGWMRDEWTQDGSNRRLRTYILTLTLRAVRARPAEAATTISAERAAELRRKALKPEAESAEKAPASETPANEAQEEESELDRIFH